MECRVGLTGQMMPGQVQQIPKVWGKNKRPHPPRPISVSSSFTNTWTPSPLSAAQAVSCQEAEGIPSCLRSSFSFLPFLIQFLSLRATYVLLKQTEACLFLPGPTIY